MIHDTLAETLTVWLGDPEQEHACEETTEEVVLMKDAAGRVIGIEWLHYRPSSGGGGAGLAIEAFVRTERGSRTER